MTKLLRNLLRDQSTYRHHEGLLHTCNLTVFAAEGPGDIATALIFQVEKGGPGFYTRRIHCQFVADRCRTAG